MSTTAAAAMKKLGQREAIGAALSNEQLTRQRVELLEAQIKALHVWYQGLSLWRDGVEARFLETRTFLGRLRWLFLGR